MTRSSSAGSIPTLLARSSGGGAATAGARSGSAGSSPIYLRYSPGVVAGGGDVEPEQPSDEPEAFEDPEAPADIDASALALGAVSPTYEGWTNLVALKTFDLFDLRFLQESAEDGALMLETEEDYRNVEITFMGEVTTVYLRLTGGRAYYCQVHMFGGNADIGVAVNVGSDQDDETRYSRATFTPAEIPGYPVSQTDPAKAAALENDSWTFGVAGHYVYLKYNDTEIVRFPDVLHPNVSGKVAIRNLGLANYGLARASVATVSTALYSNELIDVRDLGVKSAQLLTLTGSISSGSAVLTMSTQAHGIVADDVVIVEPTQSRGEEGPGGTWPSAGYANEAAILALPPAPEWHCVYAEDTKDVYQSDSVTFVRLATDGDAWYHEKMVPRPLLARVIAVDGATITLDTAASAATTNARVFVDCMPALQALLSTPNSYPKVTDGSVDVEEIFPSLSVRFPEGIFATGLGPLVMRLQTAPDVRGAGSDSTIFYAPNYCEQSGLNFVEVHNGYATGFGSRGTFQVDGSGWDMSTDTPPRGDTQSRAFRIYQCTGTTVMEDVHSVNGWMDLNIGHCIDGVCQFIDARVTHTDPIKMYIGAHIVINNSIACEMHLTEVDSQTRFDAIECFNSHDCLIECDSARNAVIVFNSSRDCTIEVTDLLIESTNRDETYMTAEQLDAAVHMFNHLSVENCDGNTVRNTHIVVQDAVQPTYGWIQGHAFIGAQLIDTTIEVAGSNSAFYQDGVEIGEVAISGCTFVGGKVRIHDGSVSGSSGPLLERAAGVTSTNNDFDSEVIV